MPEQVKAERFIDQIRREREEAAIGYWEKVVSKRVNELYELAESGFLEDEGRYGLEQLLDVTEEAPEAWNTINPALQKLVIQGAGRALGIDFQNITEEQIIGQETREGVLGAITEGNVEVLMVHTKYQNWRLEIMQYENAKAGTRYDLVYKASV